MRFDREKLLAYYADEPGDISLGDIDLARIPSHVSIIMDGNGRWATKRGLDRAQGHVAGVDSLREAVTTSVRLGFDVLSVYAFSTENWRRPKLEVDLLIRTSGELRLSNYFLYQLAYTEFYATDTLWPDFSRWDMLRAIRDFQGRSRRYGGV